MRRPLFAFIVCCFLAGFVSSCVSMHELLNDQEEDKGFERTDDPPSVQPLFPGDEPGMEYDEFGRPVARTPDESLGLVVSGKQQLAMGDHTAAIDAFTKAIAIDPGLADAYYYRGLAYDSGGDYERAAEDFSMTADINPDYVKAYFSRAEVYVKSGEVNKAIDDFGKACSMGYTAACSEREKLTGSLEGPVFDDGKTLQ
ncbi:MAG: tetratricopeptide repeat protein [Deltaproteobacteria bacterium]|nr:tetratricopeptide repeat protein [Deltaproteobacteria bacterium]